MPYRRKRDGKWLGQVRSSGERLTSPPLNTKKEALDWEAGQRNRKEPTPTVATTCGELADAYIDHCLLRYVSRTVSQKKAIFKRLFKTFTPRTSPHQISSGDALAYLSAVAGERTGYVANTHRTHLIAWWNWMARFHGLLAPNPFLPVERFPAAKLVKHVPTMEDFLQVLDYAKDQDRVLLLTYLHTAARRCELFKMTWADIDFGGRRIRLWTNKTRGQGARADWLDMTDELAAALWEWKRLSVDTIYVFHRQDGRPYSTRHTWLPDLCAKAGVKPFHYHAIRHLTATYLANANEPLPVVSSILRHRSLAVTERYIRNLKPQREALKILPFTGKSQQKANSVNK